MKAFLKLLFLSVSILLNSHPNSSILYQFFQDKTDLLRDFIYLLKTGPGSGERGVDIPLDIRIHACRCLVAIVGSRDNSSVSVLGRFSWLQHELGVNRGQYMGLLPCLLRSTALYLMGQEVPASIDPDTTESDNDDRMRWIEMILILTQSLIQTSTALQALTDNGFVALAISLLQQMPAENRSPLRLGVETVVVQVKNYFINLCIICSSFFKRIHAFSSASN